MMPAEFAFSNVIGSGKRGTTAKRLLPPFQPFVSRCFMKWIGKFYYEENDCYLLSVFCLLVNCKKMVR
jgi:hypothetical protein